VNQHTSTRLDSALDEFVAFWKMLKQVLILDIVHLNSLVCEAVKKTLLHRQL
jgi:hypothetical protein